MMSDRSLWRNAVTGEVLSIPAGDGEHLRPLGWEPAEYFKHADPEPEEPTPDGTPVTPKKRATSRKTLA